MELFLKETGKLLKLLDATYLFSEVVRSELMLVRNSLLEKFHIYVVD